MQELCLCPVYFYLESDLQQAFFLSSGNQHVLIVIYKSAHWLPLQMAYSAVWVEGTQNCLSTECRRCMASHYFQDERSVKIDQSVGILLDIGGDQHTIWQAAVINSHPMACCLNETC